MASFPEKFRFENLWIVLLLIINLSSCSPDSGIGCSPKLGGYPGCNELELNATLHFIYDRENPSLSVVFVATPLTPKGWVGWGINPKGSGMIGAQLLAAFRSNNQMMVNTFSLKSYHVVPAGKISIEVLDARAEQMGEVYKLYATIRIPRNIQSINHTWSIGHSVTEKGDIVTHTKDKPNLKWGKGELHLTEGSVCSVRDRAIKMYQISYKLGWTIFFFSSLIIEKYVDIYPSAHPWWFYLHAGFQVGGYAVGAYSWGISMILASEISEFGFHLTIGTVIFIFATAILIYTLFVMPNKDHRNGSYWNLANKLGYLVILIGVVHVFLGFKVFGHEETRKSWYSAIVSFLFGMLVLLEILTCTTRTR